jgi:hypothetical protein
MQATRGELGSAEEILRQRTVLASYWPFASGAARRMVLEAATDSSGIPIALALGLPASKLGASHPLRYCPTCHREALSRDGYSTWLLRHQLPGAWWCATHDVPLYQVPQRRAAWRKPGRDGFALGTPASTEEGKALQTVERLAGAIASLQKIDEVSLSARAVHRLRQLGIATSSARLNTGKMTAWLEGSPLIRWMRRQGDMVPVLHGNWANDLLRGRTRAHPLKWAVLWTCAWQTDSTAGAVQAFIEAASSARPLSGEDQQELWPDMGEAEMTLPLPDEVAAAFGNHVTLRAVANALGCNLGAVRQWLVDYPLLANQWLAQVHARRMADAVRRIEHCMNQMPSTNRTQLLNACNTDFNWLSRHAPAVVRRLLERVPTDRGPQRDLF